jgi:hypothetical protein
MELNLNMEDIERSYTILCENLHEDREIDSSVENALDISFVASNELHKIGKDKLFQIKEAIDRKDYLEPEVIDFYPNDCYLPTGYIDKENVGCGIRILSTYKTLKKYKEKVDEFRKLNRLEKIL